MNLENLAQHIQSRPDLDFGTIFSRSIELFKKVWLQGFITLLLTFIVILPFYILFYVPMIAAGITDREALEQNELPPMMVIAMVILLPVLLLAITTMALALNAAFLKICKQKDMDEVANDDYFYFFKEGRLGKVFILSLYLLGLSLLGGLACGLGVFLSLYTHLTLPTICSV